TLKKLKFSWSYRHYQEDLATLNCVALEGDRLAQSNDYLNSLAAIDLFRAIDGYDSASERGAILVLVNEQYGKEAKVRWPKTLGARDKADKFDILGIALGMTLQDVKVFLPEAVVARDSRGTKSLPQLDTLYVKNLSTGNKIQLRVLIGKPGDAPPTAYDLQYSFDMKGLGLKQIINVIQKLYEKYGKPDLDLTRMAKPFDYDAFLVDLQSQFDPELKYCWGDCAYQNAEKPDEGLAPGIRMEMSFMKEISLLKLRLVNGTGKDDEVIPIKIDEPIAQNLKKTESTTPKTQSTEPHPEEVPVTAPEPTASSKQQDNDQFNPASLFDESEGNTLEF
ncbi:MAG: hypothetical protein KDD43_15190, partial [Bdellovibrionales bacterium]|nr:hypothetical protein [Bdellovibrionales bacterium]